MPTGIFKLFGFLNYDFFYLEQLKLAYLRVISLVTIIIPSYRLMFAY